MFNLFLFQFIFMRLNANYESLLQNKMYDDIVMAVQLWLEGHLQTYLEMYAFIRIIFLLVIEPRIVCV